MSDNAPKISAATQLSLRKLALEHAVEIVKATAPAFGEWKADIVVGAAKKFETYLLGEEKN